METKDKLTADMIEMILNKPDIKSPDSDLRVSAAGNCLRKMDYDHVLGVKPLDALTYFRFEVGHRLDEIFKGLFVELLGEDFCDYDRELVVTTPKGRKITGHPDGRIKSLNATVEIKSCSQSSFSIVEQTGAPLGEHFEQANLYAHAMGTKDIVFLYFNKNSSQFMIVTRQYDEAQAMFNLEKFDLAADNREASAVSPRLYLDEKARPCYYCPHRVECYKDFVQDAESLATGVVVEDPKIYSMVDQYNTARLQRLDLEKVEDRLLVPIIKALVQDEEAKDATVKGEKSFKVSIKPAKNKRFQARITEEK